MAKLLHLANYRRRGRRPVTFDRRELRQLLDVYSRRVASGEWKDYAIDHGSGTVVFSIFRHTFDTPVFAVSKRANGRQCDYLVMSGREEIKHGASMGEVLSVFDRPLRLIAGRR